MSDAISAALAVLDSKPLDLEVAKARALIVGYHDRWCETFKDYKVIEVESEFTFPLINPKTEGRSQTFNEAGKIDAVLQHRSTERFLVLEHKTTSDEIDAGSDYWAKLGMDTQCSKYFLALRSRDLPVGNLLYDVIRKPGSRPHQIASLDDDGVKIVLDADGRRIRTLNGKKWRETGDSEKGWILQAVQETPKQYGSRLLSEIQAEPHRYYSQREVPRLDTELLAYMTDAWVLAQEILFRRRFDNWSRNPDACTRYAKCEFYDLCTGRSQVDGIRYRLSEKHRELTIEEEDRELLTNSRLAALRKCARYHYHRYERPIEPVAEESEALRFGTLMHSALEAYFRTLQQQNHE